LKIIIQINFSKRLHEQTSAASLGSVQQKGPAASSAQNDGNSLLLSKTSFAEPRAGLGPGSTHPVVDVDVHVPLQQHDDDVGVAAHAGQGQGTLPLLRQRVGVGALGTARVSAPMGEGAPLRPGTLSTALLGTPGGPIREPGPDGLMGQRELTHPQ